MLKNSVLDVLGNARQAAQEARQQLIREVSVANAAARRDEQQRRKSPPPARNSPDRNPSAATSSPVPSNNNNNNNNNNSNDNPKHEKIKIDVLFEKGGSTPRHLVGSGNAGSSSSPAGAKTITTSTTTLIRSSRNTPRRAGTPHHYEALTNTPEEINWMSFVSNVSDKEQAAANAAAHMKIDDLDEHGQMESDFLSGLDEETWDFDADLFSAVDDETQRRKHRLFAQQQSSSAGGGGGDAGVVGLLAAGAEFGGGGALVVPGASVSDLVSPETKRKNAERTTFWTLRRIIEKLQSRLKSVVQQRDSYKTILGRYSYVASELHSAARRCDAATAVLSERYRRVVTHEMAGRDFKPAVPPGTVIFGHAGSQQGKEMGCEVSLAAFAYPVDGNAGFDVVQPRFVEEQRSIVTPAGAARGGGADIGIPTRGVDWEIVDQLEKSAAKAVASTHDEELRHLNDQLKAAYRRHCRDIRTVATMRRSVGDALEHAHSLEKIIAERDGTIDTLKAQIKHRDTLLELEKAASAKLRGQIQELMQLRSELDAELGKAGDNEHDLGERLKDLKSLITTATQQKERDAAQRKEEGARLRAAMLDYTREMEGAVDVWRKQWQKVQIRSQIMKEQQAQRLLDAQRGIEQHDEVTATSSGNSNNSHGKGGAHFDFASQWIVVNEIFEQKRVDLSSRCNADQVTNWNHIFKPVLDMWRFAKDVHESLRTRDDLLQRQYTTFEEQVRPLLFELRQVDDAAAEKDGRAGDGSGGGISRAASGARAIFAMSRALNRFKRTSGSGDSESAEQKKQDENRSANALELRKDVVDGIRRVKQFVANFAQEDLSPVIAGFSTLFCDMFARHDSLWLQEHEKSQSELEATRKKLHDTQLALTLAETSRDELIKSVTEAREELGELQRRRNAWNIPGIETGGDWSELCPQLAAAQDGLEARFDTLRTAVARSAVAPADLAKLRADVVDDLEHFDRVLAQVRRSDVEATFPPGFVPLACLQKLVATFGSDARWMKRALGQTAVIDALEQLSTELHAALGDVKLMRAAACAAAPSPTLVESRFLPEQELALRAKATGHLGANLRRTLARFSSVCSVLAAANKAVAGTGDGLALLCGTEMAALLGALTSGMQALVEELQATMVAGALGQWSTVHRALMECAADKAAPAAGDSTKKKKPQHSDNTTAAAAAAAAELLLEKQQQQQVVDDAMIKPGGHCGAVFSAFLETAFETMLGPAPIETLPAQLGGSADDGTPSSSSSNNNNNNANKFRPTSIDEVVSSLTAEMDPQTARLLIGRFEEMVLCRSGFAAPFIGASNVKDNEEELHMIATLQNDRRDLLKQVQFLAQQLHETEKRQMASSSKQGKGGGGGGLSSSTMQQTSGGGRGQFRKMSPVSEMTNSSSIKPSMLMQGSATSERRGSSSSPSKKGGTAASSSRRKSTLGDSSRDMKRPSFAGDSSDGSIKEGRGAVSFADPSSRRGRPPSPGEPNTAGSSTLLGRSGVITKDRSTQVEKRPRLLDSVHAAALILTTGSIGSGRGGVGEDDDNDDSSNNNDDRAAELSSGDPNRMSAPAVRIKALARSAYNKQYEAPVWNGSDQDDDDDDGEGNDLQRAKRVIVVDIAAQTDGTLLKSLVEEKVALLQMQMEQQEQTVDRLRREAEHLARELELSHTMNHELHVARQDGQQQQQQEQQQQQSHVDSHFTQTSSRSAVVTSARGAGHHPDHHSYPHPHHHHSLQHPGLPPQSPISARGGAAAAAVRPHSAASNMSIGKSSSSFADAADEPNNASSTVILDDEQLQRMQHLSAELLSQQQHEQMAAAAVVAAAELQAMSSSRSFAVVDPVLDHFTGSSTGSRETSARGSAAAAQTNNINNNNNNNNRPVGELSFGAPVSARRPPSSGSVRTSGHHNSNINTNNHISSPLANSLNVAQQQQQQQPSMPCQGLLLSPGGFGSPSLSLLLSSPSAVAALGASFGRDSTASSTAAAAAAATASTAAALKEKPHMATRSTQVAFDAIKKPATAARDSQTDWTTHRQFVKSVNVSPAAPYLGGRPAVDFRKPHQWVPADWKLNGEDTVVSLPEAEAPLHSPHLRHEMSVASGVTPAGRSRPPTPSKTADLYYRPKSGSDLVDVSAASSQSTAVRQWKIQGSGGAMFVLRLERPKWAQEEAEMRRQRGESVGGPEQLPPWQPSTAHLYGGKESSSEDSALQAASAAARRRSPSPNSSSSYVRPLSVRGEPDLKVVHRRFDSPSSLNSLQSSARQRVLDLSSGHGVVDISQQLARELQQLTTTQASATMQRPSSATFSVDHAHAQQFDVERVRELSYIRKRLDEAEHFSSPSPSGTENTTATAATILRPTSEQEMTILQHAPHYNRSVRPLSAAQLSVAKQYASEGRSYAPPPTAMDHALDAEFCREVGLTPQGGIRSRPAPTDIRRPASPASHERAMAAANGGVFLSKTVERALAARQMRKQQLNASQQHQQLQRQQQESNRMPVGIGTLRARQLLQIPGLIRNNVQSEDRGTGSGLRSDAQTREIGAVMVELANDPLTTQEVSRRREFAAVSHLATTLCGPDSLLARKLAQSEASQQ